MPAIPRWIIDEMVEHAVDAPVSAGGLREEICGLIGARSGQPEKVYRIANVADRENRRGSPYRYEMDSQDLFRALKEIESNDGSLFAIYHSHVASPAYPSPTDVRQAFLPPDGVDQEPMFPGTYYILVSLEHDEADVRAYLITRGGEITEEPIEVV